MWPTFLHELKDTAPSAVSTLIIIHILVNNRLEIKPHQLIDVTLIYILIIFISLTNFSFQLPAFQYILYLSLIILVITLFQNKRAGKKLIKTLDNYTAFFYSWESVSYVIQMLIKLFYIY